MFKKRLYQDPINLLKANKKRVSNRKCEIEIGGGSQSEKPNCAKCVKMYMGKCLIRMYKGFGFEKSGRIVKDCPIDKTQMEERVTKIKNVVVVVVLQ